MKTIHEAYAIAKKLVHTHWDDSTQVHLSSVMGNGNKFIFEFYTFIPNPNCEDYSLYDRMTVAGVNGINTHYYGGALSPILIDRESGEARFLHFSFYDHIKGKQMQYIQDNGFETIDVMEVFKYRKSGGLGYQICKE